MACLKNLLNLIPKCITLILKCRDKARVNDMYKFLGVFVLINMMIAAAVRGDDSQPTKIIQAPWGRGDGEFGLQLEAEGNCPQALAVADDGSLAILDAVNQRVQLYAANGIWNGKFSITSNSFDIRFQEHELLVLAPYDHAVFRYRRDGQLIEKITLHPRIQMIDGLGVGDPEPVVQTIDQVQYVITPNHAQQMESARLGANTRFPGVRIRTEWVDPHQGKIIIERKTAAKTQSVVVAAQDELGSLVFLDTDHYGNVYVRQELFNSAGNSYFEVDKLDRNGHLLASITIPNQNIVAPFKPITIDGEGNVYFLQVDAAGLTVIRWDSGN